MDRRPQSNSALQVVPGTPGPRRVAARFDREPAELMAEFSSTGKQECFEEIVRRYSAMVLNVCRQVTGHRQDAEDATQAVFLVFAERLRAGEKIHSPGMWLQKVARRAALDIRRSRSRRKRREQARAASEVTHPPDRLDEDAIAKVLREELDRIPAKYRIPLILHYFNGQNVVEVAGELGIKPATLGVRLFRGRKLLGERLARRGITLSSFALAGILANVIRRSISDAMVRSVAKVAITCGAGAAPPGVATFGGGLAIGWVSSQVKLIAMAAILAAAVGASAAVKRYVPLPAPIDLRRFVPSIPEFRSHLPTLRADAMPPPATNGQANPPASAPNMSGPWVAVPHPFDVQMDWKQPIYPSFGQSLQTFGSHQRSGGSIVIPPLTQPPAVARRSAPELAPLVPPLREHGRAGFHRGAPAGAGGRVASAGGGAGQPPPGLRSGSLATPPPTAIASLPPSQAGGQFVLTGIPAATGSVAAYDPTAAVPLVSGKVMAGVPTTQPTHAKKGHKPKDSTGRGRRSLQPEERSYSELYRPAGDPLGGYASQLPLIQQNVGLPANGQSSGDVLLPTRATPEPTSALALLAAAGLLLRRSRRSRRSMRGNSPKLMKLIAKGGVCESGRSR